MSESPKPRRHDVLALVAFLVLGSAFAFLAWLKRGFGLQFDSLVIGHTNTIFLGLWLILGLVVWSWLTGVVDRVGASTGLSDRVAGWLDRGTDRAWIVGGSIGALAVAVLLRVFVLRDLPVSDDERVYVWSSQLLASGRLTMPSPTYRPFYEYMFIVDDGRRYSQYFLGWPALMLPGTLLGVPGFMNGVYSALTVAPIAWVTRRYADARWSRVSILMFLASPALMYIAASGFSQTSCVFLLAWCTWATLRSTDADRPRWADPVVACTFALAFFTRPTVALGIGTPLLVTWLIGWWRRDKNRLVGLALFGAPALLFAAMFFGVQYAQTGHATLPGYVKFDSYMRETFDLELPPIFVLEPRRMLWNVLTAVERLCAGLFGWPVSYALLPKRRGPALFWWMIVSFLAVHLTVMDPGVETVPALHFLELSLPLLWLTVLGASGPPPYAIDIGRPGPAIVAGFCLAALGYNPIMLSAIRSSQASVEAPIRAVESLPDRAVIFAPWSMHCLEGGWTWALHHPLPSPDMTDDPLWLKHLSVDLDRALMRAEYPGRPGYVMSINPPCQIELHPLSDPALTLPDGSWYRAYRPKGLETLAPLLP